MKIPIQNSAQALWLIWSTLWHTFWIIAAGILFHSLLAQLKVERQQHSDPLSVLKSKFWDKNNIALAVFFIGWRFFDFAFVQALILSLILLLIIHLLSYLTIKREFPSFSYRFVLNSTQSALKKLKNTLGLAFWKENVQMQLQVWNKIKSDYLFSLVLLGFIGLIPINQMVKLSSFSLLQAPLWAQGVLIGTLLGMSVPIFTFAKIPIAAYLWYFGFSLPAVIGFVISSFILPATVKTYKKLTLGRAALVLIFAFIGVIIASTGASIVVTSAFNFHIQKIASLFYKTIKFNYDFYLNTAAVIIICISWIVSSKANPIQNIIQKSD